MTIPPEALLAGYPGPIIDLAEGLRAVVRQAIPDRIEAVHVHLGFPQGFLLDDPAGRLGGVGEAKRARWLTLEQGDEIPVLLYAAFVRQAARLARLSPSEREAIRFDREARTMAIDPQVSKSKPR